MVFEAELMLAELKKGPKHPPMALWKSANHPGVLGDAAEAMERHERQFDVDIDPGTATEEEACPVIISSFPRSCAARFAGQFHGQGPDSEGVRCVDHCEKTCRSGCAFYAGANLDKLERKGDRPEAGEPRRQERGFPSTGARAVEAQLASRSRGHCGGAHQDVTDGRRSSVRCIAMRPTTIPTGPSGRAPGAGSKIARRRATWEKRSTAPPPTATS